MCHEKIGKPFDRKEFHLPQFVCEQFYSEIDDSTIDICVMQFFNENTELICKPSYTIYQKSRYDPLSIDW